MLAGQPMVARIVHKLSVLGDDVIVVASQPERYQFLALPARLVRDERPGLGSLMGVYSGLKAARHDHALTVACDMPLLNLDLVRYMLDLADGYDMVIPRVKGLVEPLHAVYSKACLPHIARLLEQGQCKIASFFGDVRVRFVEADELDRFDPRRFSLVNINAPEDWDRVLSLLKAEDA
jgi:molybdopterin-guanine dinucleotide biosynthesis protein A